MSSQSGDFTDQQDLVEVRGENGALQQYLRIHPPDDASRTPPILSFKRKREVEIPWDEIVDSGNVTGAEAVQAIRNYFEASWGFEVNDEKWWKAPSHQLLDMEGGARRVRQVQRGKPPIIYRPDFGKLDAQGKPTAVELTEGFVIRHGPDDKGRLYRLVNEKKTLTPDHFKSYEKYKLAWQEEIEGVELVFESVADAQSCYMDFEEIDLRPAIILQKYEELRVLRDFAASVKENVNKVTDKAIGLITATNMDTDELERLQAKVLRLSVGEYDAQRRIERLASDAARMGYLLFIQKAAVDHKSPDGTVTKLEPGRLYTTYKRTARWTQYVTTKTPVRVGWWIFSRTVMRDVQVPVPREQVVELYQEVDTSRDILSETRAEMIKAGAQVYIFEQTPSGLVSTSGEPLRQVMDRCKYDEAFRRTCVVMLPVYEESLTGQRLVAKYAVYKRPLPGLVASILPRLSLEESLTYRTAWVETQLGELLNSINLAPDEERKVTITKRFEQETTVTRTSTSIFDISRQESTDLASELENQTRQEKESSKSLQFSTKASGGWGAFSAEASASGGTSSSLKDMSQAISKVASKAAKAVSSQNREEVSSTSTARTTIANTDETIATIRNINQGRSLNLMFYRLYNKYKGGLFLEGLRFDVIPSIEVIAGSGVHESKSYSLEELPGMVAEFKAAQLPFAIKDDDLYTNRLLDSIETLLRSEYAVEDGEEAKAKTPAISGAVTAATPAQPYLQAASLSVARLSLPSPEQIRSITPAVRSNGGAAPAKSSSVAQPVKAAGAMTAAARLAQLREMLRRAVIHSNEPIAPQELLVAAPGLYLDAVVGTQPSTEPYSEQMREQEVQLRAAEVSVRQAESEYQRALARQLSQGGPAGDGNFLTGLLPGTGQRSLTLSLRKPLDPGDWRLQVDGQEKAKVELTDDCRHILVFTWTIQQAWLKTDDLQSRIGLVEKNSDKMITFEGVNKLQPATA